MIGLKSMVGAGVVAGSFFAAASLAGAGSALAMPMQNLVAVGEAAPQVDNVRLVCPLYRPCYRVFGGYRPWGYGYGYGRPWGYTRPYAYYRPYGYGWRHRFY